MATLNVRKRKFNLFLIPIVCSILLLGLFLVFQWLNNPLRNAVKIADATEWFTGREGYHWLDENTILFFRRGLHVNVEVVGLDIRDGKEKVYEELTRSINETNPTSVDYWMPSPDGNKLLWRDDRSGKHDHVASDFKGNEIRRWKIHEPLFLAAWKQDSTGWLTNTYNFKAQANTSVTNFVIIECPLVGKQKRYTFDGYISEWFEGFTPDNRVLTSKTQALAPYDFLLQEYPLDSTTVPLKPASVGTIISREPNVGVHLSPDATHLVYLQRADSGGGVIGWLKRFLHIAPRQTESQYFVSLIVCEKSGKNSKVLTKLQNNTISNIQWRPDNSHVSFRVGNGLYMLKVR